MALDLDLDIDDAGRPIGAVPQRTGSWRAALIALFAVGLLLVAVALGAFVEYRRLLVGTAAEAHTLQVLNRLDGFFSSVLDAQNARRGFMITGDDSLLLVFDSAVTRATQDFAALAELTADDELQVARVAELRPSLAEFFDELQDSMQQRGGATRLDELQVSATRRGEQLLEAIRAHVSAMIDDENRLLEARRDSAHRSSRRASTVLAEGAVLALLLVAALTLMVYREDRRRRRAERSLRAGLGFLDEVIEALPVLTAIKDARDLRYVRLNRAGETLLGMSPSEFVGKRAVDLFPREQAEWIEANDREALASRTSVDLPPATVSGRKGDLVFHSRKTALRDSAGNPRYLLTVSEDVTEQSANEKEIKRLNAELESSLASALVANKELESFAYSVSHDLRAPLRAAHSFAMILREDHAGALDAEGRRLLEVVIDSASSMGELIDDLLALSRLSRQEMRLEDVDTAALMRTVLAEIELQGRVGSSQITLGDLPHVHADAGLLHRAFANLLSNALKYSRHSTPPRVDVTAVKRAGDHVFTVRDNGVGFDMKYVGRLFTAFQRLHSASDFEGTGIGLALVRRVVERHGGRVWAEAEVNKGATFSFSLPVFTPASG